MKVIIYPFLSNILNIYLLPNQVIHRAHQIPT